MASPKASQNITVIAGAVGIIALAVCSTLYFTGQLDIGKGAGEEGYRNVTFTDAVLACQEEVRDEFDNKLQHMLVDSHSSRFDNADSFYKIFLTVEAKGKSSTANQFFINCYVVSSNGRIKEFEIFEQKEVKKSQAIKRDDDKIFQFPE